MINYRKALILCILAMSMFIACAKEGAQAEKKGTQRSEASGVVSVEGAGLHYVIEGQGIPCIVLGHTESQRRILSQKLRRHFRFVFMDLRHDAQSNSTLEITRITLDTYLDDIDTVRRTLGFQTAAIYGHSIHSYIALEYARKYPAHTTHVIMTGQTAYRVSGEEAEKFWESDASDERKSVLKENWEKINEDALNRMSPKERVVRTYLAMTPRLFYDSRYDSSWIYETVESDQNMAVHLFNVIFRDYDIAKRPGRIDTPVFLTIGRYDYLCPYFTWENRKSVLPNLSYNLFEKSGHFPMVEEQALFDKKLVEWVKNR